MSDTEYPWVAELQRKADAIRREALELARRNNGGYVIQALGAAELLVTLYERAMALGPSTAPLVPAAFPGVPGRGSAEVWGGSYNGEQAEADRFILSPAHYATALYATLIQVGRLSPDALDHYNADGGTVEMIGAEHSPGFEATTGSLAQGLSVGIGRALARARAGVGGRIWVFLSDGELQEGQTWEAFQAAAAFAVDNLTVVVDRNAYQVDGAMDLVMPIGSAADRARAFGWAVDEVDGHDLAALDRALAVRPAGRPYLLVSHSIPWQGVPSLEGRYPRKLHYIRFVAGEAEAAVADIETTIASRRQSA